MTCKSFSNNVQQSLDLIRRRAALEERQEHHVVDLRAEPAWDFGHRDHVVGHEEGSWSDAGPHTPLAQRAVSRHAISLDKNKRGRLSLV